MTDDAAATPPPEVQVTVRGAGKTNHEAPGTLIQGYVNPLAFLEVDEPWVSARPAVPVTDDHLRFMLCHPEVDSTLDSVVERYKSISVEGNHRIFIAPIGFLGKLIWPLRHAKMAFALGNTIGTIALCGMVCEMAQLLLFEAHADYHGYTNQLKAPVTKYSHLYEPGAFQRERQRDRSKVLFRLGLIDKNTHDAMVKVGRTRSRYLHLLSQALSDVEDDAIDVFIQTCRIVTAVLGLGISSTTPGAVSLRPEILKLAHKREAEIAAQLNASPPT